MTGTLEIAVTLKAGAEITTEVLQQIVRFSDAGLDQEAIDRLEDGVLMKAAGCYLVFSDPGAPREWPLDPSLWRPDCPRADFIRALSLYVLEIAKIDRKAGW